MPGVWKRAEPNTASYLRPPQEGGESITVNGQKVALGIPQPKGASAGKTGVNSVPDIPLGRAGTADEAARAMLFLASPLAGYISGHTLGACSSRASHQRPADCVHVRTRVIQRSPEVEGSELELGCKAYPAGFSCFQMGHAVYTCVDDAKTMQRSRNTDYGALDLPSLFDVFLRTLRPHGHQKGLPYIAHAKAILLCQSCADSHVRASFCQQRDGVEAFVFGPKCPKMDRQGCLAPHVSVHAHGVLRRCVCGACQGFRMDL